MSNENGNDRCGFASVLEVIEDLREGKMVILLDDEDRENEGDLVCAAEFVTPEIVNFMATQRAWADLHADDRRAARGAGDPADGGGPTPPAAGRPSASPSRPAAT